MLLPWRMCLVNTWEDNIEVEKLRRLEKHFGHAQAATQQPSLDGEAARRHGFGCGKGVTSLL